MYIIDEVHMLSTSAFNGLLKILEEPPAHAIFILATTALDKIPATIQSRCVRVDFGTAAVEDVKRMIQRICAHEKITLDPEVMSLIATHCDRSFRDATKILEELILQKALTLTDAQKYLGTRAKDTLLVQLLAQDANNAITWSYQYASEGGDMKLLIEDTLRQIHALLLQTYGIEPDIMPPVVSFTRPQLVKLLRVFHDAYVLVRVSPIPQSAVQIAIMEYYKP
jgi:DNA polymerase-3 subunit gamma/tau